MSQSFGHANLTIALYVVGDVRWIRSDMDCWTRPELCIVWLTHLAMVAPLGQRWMRTSRGKVTRYVAAVETSEGGADYGDVVVVASLPEILPHPSGSSKLSSKTRIVPPSNNSYNRAFPAF